MKQLFTVSALLATMALAACGGGRTTQTSQSLAEIIHAERGSYAASPVRCEVPAALIGKPNSEIANAKINQPVRVIYPGTAVTGDQIVNRLNFKVDKKGIIRDITCG